MGSHVLTVNHTVKSHPKFTHVNYHRWRGEVSFWREIHAFAGDKTLISDLACGIHDLSRSIQVSFLRDTRSNVEDRTFNKLFAILDKEFQKDSSRRAMRRMSSFRNFS